MSVLYKALNKNKKIQPLTAAGTSGLRPLSAQTSTYVTSLEARPARIILPRRDQQALAWTIAVCSVFAAAFVLLQPEALAPKLVPIVRPAMAAVQASTPPIALPSTTDPRLDEAAELIPAAAAAALPVIDVDRKPQAAAHPVRLTVHNTTPPAVRSKSDEPDQTLMAAGIAAARAGNYELADRRLRQALASDRTNPLILYNLAVVADRRGDQETARTLYSASLDHAAERPDLPYDGARATARLARLNASTEMAASQ